VFRKPLVEAGFAVAVGGGILGAGDEGNALVAAAHQEIRDLAPAFDVVGRDARGRRSCDIA
jgi:hypothetical protein